MADRRPPKSKIHPLYGVAFLMCTFLCALFGCIGILGPMLVVLFYDVNIYRQYTDFWLRTWLCLPSAIFEIISGTKIVITGDNVPRNEPTLIVMNHRCRLDWMFYWMVLFRNGNLRYEKIMLRDDLRHVPGAGWAIQSALFIFLQRKWDKDEAYLKEMMNYYRQEKYPLQLLLFPEGTNLCRSGVARSEAYAKKNDLRNFIHVLHPRVRGFTFVVDELRDTVIKSVQDVTIGYKNTMCFNELDLLKGHFPGEIHVHIKRYPINELPKEEHKLEEWCKEKWDEKEDRLIDFYKTGKFAEDPTSSPQYKQRERKIRMKYYGILLFWVLYGSFSTYLFWTSWSFRIFSYLVTVFYLSVAYVFGGLDLLQLELYKKQHCSSKEE